VKNKKKERNKKRSREENDDELEVICLSNLSGTGKRV
jgi:hypothetical protein